MTNPAKAPTQSIRSFRDRRLSLNRSIRDLERESGIHRARLSMIERGMMPNLTEHHAIEAALVQWEAPA